MPGEKLFDIADLSTVWIMADIYESELPLVREGQLAVISLSYFPGKEIHSTIDYIYPALSGDTRTARARFVVPNPVADDTASTRIAPKAGLATTIGRSARETSTQSRDARKRAGPRDASAATPDFPWIPGTSRGPRMERS